MKIRRWFVVFAGACAAVAALFALFNAAVDPFGVFGDRLMDWYAYDMTQNPRVAKIAYLEKHHDAYDSYVIGSSKASSLSCERLNEYMDASFYNMTWYGGKIGDEIAAASYLISNYEVKNIVLLLEPQNATNYASGTDDLKQRMHCAADGSSAAAFYLSYLFCNPSYALDKLDAWLDRGYLVTEDAVYTPETGSYNKQRRDVAAIGGTEQYLASYVEEFAEFTETAQLPYIEQCMEAVTQLRDLCAASDVTLTVLTAPQYQSEFLCYDRQQMADFWRALAEVVDFWDFSGLNSVNTDARYFYDRNHFRNSAGDMALARIFGDDTTYVPEDFGAYVTAETVDARLEQLWSAENVESQSAQVPILLYHSLTEDAEEASGDTMSVACFRSHMEALSQAGYTAVSYQALYDYVTKGTQLPEKPVVITFDDGYEDNLTLAAPILQSYGFRAEIAVIGCSIGHSTYKDTDEAIIPHFSLDAARPWVEAGVISLGSHSYDMHQVERLDGAGCREGVLQLVGESEADYVAALRADCAQEAAALDEILDEDAVRTFAYPYGKYSEISEIVLREQGIALTVTTVAGMAELVRGLPQSLRALPRYAVSEDTTAEALLALLGS